MLILGKTHELVVSCQQKKVNIMTADNKEGIREGIVEVRWDFPRREDERLEEWLNRLPIKEKERILLREQAEENEDLTGK